MDEELLADVRAHDAKLARSGLAIWIGSEPTFTNPRSQHPCWLTEAEGGEKEAHARALLIALAPRLSGPVQLLRVPGRRYPGEATARFCLGALFARRGDPCAAKPPLDPLDAGELAPIPSPGDGQAWLTITPDPAVVEVNMAPAHDLATFAVWSEAVYAAAAEAGLSPTRFRYNGELTDSGGGGQITLGGPSPEQSPFFVRPQLLPGLVRYCNRHPSLSYLFAGACCGSASQGPRPDEGVRERFDELPVALDHLAARGDALRRDELWSALAPLLVDASGSSHRAELNVEKLWNPWFSGSGQLGLVELRALRMPPSAARLTALAALFRALAARLAAVPYRDPVIDWGPRLHEMWALPWFLERDLERVLEDLELHGFGLGPRLRSELRARPEPIAVLRLGEASLEVQRAVSFWPLVGDVASQEERGARLVDSSAQRVQLLVSAPHGSALGRIGANGWRVPLHPLPGDFGQRALGGVQYRAFVPRPGLHPGMPAHDPLVLDWERGGSSVRAKLHAWLAEGGAYDGLPRDEAEARARRRARALITTPAAVEIRASAATGWLLDLRRERGTGGPELTQPANGQPRAPARERV